MSIKDIRQNVNDIHRLYEQAKLNAHWGFTAWRLPQVAQGHALEDSPEGSGYTVEDYEATHYH